MVCVVDVGLVEWWLLGLDQDSYEQAIAALELLAERGPQLMVHWSTQWFVHGIRT
ncbi:MAG: hypothetical protein NVS2B15_21850 [Pseudarthrobacter sp.]